MPTATHILVAEDDSHIREGLIDTLESEGYTVHSAAHGQAALDTFQTQPELHLILLDIMMPELSGFDVCREIRKQNEHIPIIMLTAKSQEIDKVIGLELGADDYITKPFGVRELIARVAAILRRAQRQPPTTTEDPESLRFGQATIYRRTYRGRLHDQQFDLTKLELELLLVLHAHPGEVLTRDDLLQMVWGQQYFGTTRTLDQHIAQLRKKIEPDPAHPTVITTAHGIGYRYEGQPA